MSTLKTSNIQDTSGNNNSTPEEINKGRAKAWVNYDGTNTATSIRQYFNVSSITEHRSGDWTVNFTNNMANADYCVSGGASDLGASAGYRWLAVGSGYGGDFSKTTSGVRVQAVYDSASRNQAAHVYVVIHGD